MITHEDIEALCGAAAEAGFHVEHDRLDLRCWEGGEGHFPVSLPPNMAAVYVFKWNDAYLKVGKVNAKSNARYKFHHYKPDSSKSNLASSLLGDKDFQPRIGCSEVGAWIKTNTTRFNILIPEDLGKDFVHFAEAFFILKCRPRFEDSRK